MDWKYLQTPQFTLSSARDETLNLNIELTVRHGIITGGSISEEGQGTEVAVVDDLRALQGQKLHEIRSWKGVLDSLLPALSSQAKSTVVSWLQRMLPPR